MGFGGGDFGGGGGGGGGFDNDFGSSYDSYSYSSDSHYSSGGSSDTSSGFATVLTTLMCFSVIAIPVAIWTSSFLGINDGCSFPVYCSNGTSLNPSEQMWCVPPNVTTVTGRRQTGVNFYRIKEGKLPSLIERAVSVERVSTVDRNGYKYYSFFMNPGSLVNASLTSESGIDNIHCYLIDSSNMDLFTAGKAFVAIFHGYKKCSISFNPEKSDTYYLTFGYRAKTGVIFAYVYFSMNFTYKVYDISSLKPEGGNNSKMVTFESVGTDEVIVADNSMLNESFVTLRLPDGIDLVPLC